ncbi:MAG: pyridine nucleotide-disulfide oxidoreductase [Deltaproteobacteria bacterium HGW-Deltaproteobacteria-8]|jgi:NADPH-dependent 2,4-dienoyl-CoA reductase/sulfur reductase-like enzyme/rhodanese-related sulfurtransferase|nr:MAG: pyridine nucleotide-disulfide oxidoreductase [Deltaproteobacteria bacterium HGW-Deltaproteobacteria-8]
MQKHVVIIGAVALGPKAAARFKRLEPDSRVTMIDREKLISYGGCGIPYFVSGDVSDAVELQKTAFHMVRDVEFFRATKGVDVRTETEAVAIDRAAKTVTVRHLPTGREETLTYDKLVLATGSTPSALPVPGAQLGGIHAVNGLDAAQRIRALVSGGKVSRAVVVGAGFIGLELAVALADMWGVETTVVEFRDQILPGVIGGNLARMAQKHMEEKGVVFRLGEQVRTFANADGGIDEGQVARVVTDKAELEADLVIVAIGVRPNSGLARGAGLDVSERGGIKVDDQLRTSDPDIYAGGDCVELKHLITGGVAYLPLGSLANRQGRVIGTNLAGGASTFAGAVGSWCVKLFDLSAAGTGLTLAAAKAAGFDALNVHVSQLDRAHFYPDKGLMSLELVVERKSGRVLGMQGLAVMGDALVGKVDVVAALLHSSPTVEDLSGLEMAYSPPFAAALDILNVLGNATENILSGRNKGIQVDEFAKLWAGRTAQEPYILDCREHANVEELLQKHPGHWHNIPQGQLRERLAEIPRDTGVVLVCNTGARSYEAFITLAHAGFGDVVSVEGGMTAVLAAGVEV